VQRSDDVNTPKIALIGVVGALVVFVMIVALQVWFYHLQEIEIYKKDISQTPEEISSLLAQQQGQLYGYRWVDAKKKIAAVPIDVAMKLVVRDLSGPTTATATSQGSK
jgi:hypothetical protein